jgi:peptidoglycan-associated lipoprotein
MIGFNRLASIGIVAAIGTYSPLFAQAGDQPIAPVPSVEIAIDYSYMRANAGPAQCGCFSMQGGSAEVALHAWRTLSVVADLTGQLTGSATIPGQSLALVFVTGGPRFTYRIHHSFRYAPFAQGLVGVVHGFDAPFPTNSGQTIGASSSIAAFMGGGLDIAINHHLSIRPIQADYGLSYLPNNKNDQQNLFRYTGGIVLRLW